MKSFFFLSFILFLNASTSFACHRSHSQYLCPGDTVFSENGFSGTVLGINPAALEAAVRWWRTPEGAKGDVTMTHKYSGLAIADGCIDAYCVGDVVVSANGFTGAIAGVNPYAGTAAVHWDKTPEGVWGDLINTIPITGLSLGYGCLNNFCVGDTVISSNGFVGIIVGINKYTEKAGVQWYRRPEGTKYSLTSTVRIDSLSNSALCAEYSQAQRALSIDALFKVKLGTRQLISGFDFSFYLP